MKWMRFAGKSLLTCLMGLMLSGGNAAASGLQVSPITLSLVNTQNADGIWLSNEGDAPINAQVRVFHWTQTNYTDKLSPSQGLVISPPMLALAPGQRQLIRVIRMGPPSPGMEDAWRLSINELPPSVPKKNALQFVLHYSVPVFVQPAGVTDTFAKLQWQLRHVDGNTFLEVNNQGNGHAQLSEASFVTPSGTRRVITPGLLGYVLPGATMRWIIPSSASAGGKLEVTVNGQKTVQAL